MQTGIDSYSERTPGITNPTVGEVYERWQGRRSALRPHRPIRILEFRGAEGAGGGPEKTILQGAAWTNPRRFSVTVCYIRNARDRDFAIECRARETGVNYVEVLQRQWADLGLWRACLRLIQERRIDIIHAHDYKTNLLALLLARSAQVIPLSTAHGWTGHSWRERFLYYPVDKRLLAQFPQVIAVSGQIRQDLIQAGTRPDRVRTIWNGIDHRAFRRHREREKEARAKWGICPDEKIIGAMGRLEPQKRFDVLLGAFASLFPRRPEFRLVIAGEGSAREALEATAHRLGVASACRFFGHCTDVAEFHHAVDVLVQSSDYEGTPNVLLEAMALETPIVATDVGGTNEIVTDGVHGILVPPRSPWPLAAAVERTFEDRWRTAERVRTARARVETELSFDARMQAVEAVYESLMKSRY
jgi:glycosyltransferase involved in cell wall biosynthesis